MKKEKCLVYRRFEPPFHAYESSISSPIFPSPSNVSLLHDAFPHATSLNDDLNVDDDDGILWLDSPYLLGRYLLYF